MEIGRAVSKPWGFYKILSQGEGWWVKLLVVMPHQRTSLQSHAGRTEHWTCVSGEGAADIEKNGTLYSGRFAPSVTARILPGIRHRLVALLSSRLVVIEVATGTCDEDDIVRYEDDYGRV